MTSQPFAVVFPGQGAQSPGMGLPWKDHPAWSVVERAEKVLERPLAPLLTGDTSIDLSRTANSQMSVLLVSLMAWEAIHASTGTVPVAFAGHSLGQVTALIAAEAVSFDDGVRLASTRADLTQRAADTRPGKMAALLGASPEQAAAACEHNDECWIANDNTNGQVVIAGTPDGLDAAVAAAREAGVRKILPINVGGAFHTPLMQEASTAQAEFIETIELRDTAVPIVSNTSGEAVTDAAGWPQRLADHLVRPVRWSSCMETLAALTPRWVEAGPGTTLAAFARRAQPDVKVMGVSTPADVAASAAWTEGGES